MRCLGTWCSGGLGSVRFTVGLDLKGLFQPIRFCDSVIGISLLLDNLARYRLDKWSARWVGNWFTGHTWRVMITVIWTMRLKAPSKLADDKQGGEVDTSERRAILQRPGQVVRVG
ncbi:hypothetical protein QYF61_025627 [Mycteria americana]|uniref:Uncharacterized protein n=1 Tax=Mycteria americana TaxID=33587 RepID=A0AAN7PMG4_MYCAM|nr:hypothetical protein QYF61_025627 [Mycteria americana]